MGWCSGRGRVTCKCASGRLLPWTAVGTARNKAMLEERTLTEGTERTRQNPAQGFQARWLTEARRGETVRQAGKRSKPAMLWEWT